MLKRWGTLCGFFLVSFSLLFLEILITRIFSFVLVMNIGYLVISIALLGLGAGGVYDSVRPAQEVNFQKRIGWSALLSSVSLLVVFYLVSLIGFPGSAVAVLALILYYPLVFIPFFFIGYILAITFRFRVEIIGTLYGVNMVASGLGCLAALALLRGLGAEKLLLFAAGLISFAGFLFVAGHSLKKLQTVCLCFFGVCIVLGLFSDSWLQFQPSMMKPLGYYRNIWSDYKVEFSRWDPLGRVDVISSKDNLLTFEDEQYLIKGMTIDGTANTPLIPWGSSLETTAFYRGGIHGQGYQLFSVTNGAYPKDVLCVGLGGGIDIQAALHFNAESITGVEVNKTVIDAVRFQFNEFLDGLYQKPGVEVVHADGRHFLARSEQQYDLIQFSGVDTASELSRGLNLHSESYLYTLEAFSDYYKHLKPKGVLSMFWFEMDPPRIMLRAVAIAGAALKQAGIEHPEKHIWVVQQNSIASILVSPTPFTDEEISGYIDLVEASKYKKEMIFDFYNIKQKLKAPIYFRYQPGNFGTDPFSQLMLASSSGREKEFIDNYVYDISVTTDNKPFFFKYYTWQARMKGIVIGFLLILAQLAQAIIFSLAFIIYPLWRYGKRSEVLIPKSAAVIGYFIMLGLGYILVEICLMQRFAFYLGNPSYSMALILSAMLISSGIGAAVYQAKLSTIKNLPSFAAISAALVLGFPFLFLLPGFVYSTLELSLNARTALTLIWVTPLGFLMGIPFPAGLHAIGRNYKSAVPWVFGINGAAGVVGSILTIIIAMEVGFNAVLVISAVLYLCAAVLYPAMAKVVNN